MPRRLSTYIGLQVGLRTGKVYGLVNPDRDADLRDPGLLHVTDAEPVKLVRIKRGNNGAAMTQLDVLAVTTEYERSRA
jgi:hypothetical protein